MDERPRSCLERGVHVGDRHDRHRPGGAGARSGRSRTAARPNAIVASNFALGAALLQRFAAEAARHFDAVEVIELHHDGQGGRSQSGPRSRSPAGSPPRAPARGWPRRGDDGHPGARGADVEGIRVHSVRLPGVLAHHEAIFGGPGQTLTIRHDTTDRSCYMPGVLLAISAVATRPGLTSASDALLS